MLPEKLIYILAHIINWNAIKVSKLLLFLPFYSLNLNMSVVAAIKQTRQMCENIKLCGKVQQFNLFRLFEVSLFN